MHSILRPQHNPGDEGEGLFALKASHAIAATFENMLTLHLADLHDDGIFSKAKCEKDVGFDCVYPSCLSDIAMRSGY